MAIVAATLIGGCESWMGLVPAPTPTPKPSFRPTPKTVPLRRADRADRLVVMVGSHPRDTDADGYPDSLDVTAMLFEGRQGDPVLVDGRFEFELEPLNDSVPRPWRVWQVDEAAAAMAAGPTLFDLPGYAFCLDLRKNGGDQMPPIAANLTGRFTPASGAAAVACVAGQRVVQLGGR
jgi:hypothetical protein